MASNILQLKFTHTKTQSRLKEEIVESLRLKIKTKLQSLPFLVRQYLQDLLRESIQKCELYQAVQNNQPIYFELGTIHSPVVLDELILVLQDSVSTGSLLVRKYTTGINIRLGVVAVNNSFNDVLNIPGASYVSINQKGNKTDIPWMEWLLTSPPFIEEYGVVFKISPRSRTGGALMEPITIGRTTSWALPVEFQGTQEDNFITRAISDNRVSQKLGKYIYRKTTELLRR